MTTVSDNGITATTFNVVLVRLSDMSWWTAETEPGHLPKSNVLHYMLTSNNKWCSACGRIKGVAKGYVCTRRHKHIPCKLCYQHDS